MARTLTCTDERWNCDYLKECEKPCQHHVGQTASDALPPLADAIAAVHQTACSSCCPRRCALSSIGRRLGPDCTAQQATPRRGSDGGVVAVGRRALPKARSKGGSVRT